MCAWSDNITVVYVSCRHTPELHAFVRHIPVLSMDMSSSSMSNSLLLSSQVLTLASVSSSSAFDSFPVNSLIFGPSTR